MEIQLKGNQLCGFIVIASYLCSAFTLFSMSVTTGIELERRDILD